MGIGLNADKDYAVTVTVRNNRMLQHMRREGFESAAALHRATGVTQAVIGEFLRFKRAPIKKNEQWSMALLKIAECLRCLPEDLFSPSHLRVPLEKNKAEFTANAADVHQISESLRTLAMPADERMMAAESKGALDKLLLGLLPRQERVLRLRFGMDDGIEHSCDEIGKQFDLSRSRVAQIEAIALRKLKRRIVAHRSLEDALGYRMKRAKPGACAGNLGW